MVKTSAGAYFKSYNAMFLQREFGRFGFGTLYLAPDRDTVPPGPPQVNSAHLIRCSARRHLGRV